MDPVQKSKASLLIVEDDALIRKSLSAMLEDEGYQITTSPEGADALRRLEREDFDLVISDVMLPRVSGLEILREIQSRFKGMEVILITGYATVEQATTAIKEGAYDYIEKPLDDDKVKRLIEKALEKVWLQKRNTYLEEQLDDRFGLDNMRGRDPKMREIFEMIKVVAETDTTVLIEGESGTGKTLIARAIHHNSPRRSGPLVEVSCGVLSETLLESELFGHEKGSFTGAISDKKGKFELADGGTILLDEIDTLPLRLQVKLLRVIQNLEFERVGGNETLHVDVRVISAANRDLEGLVRQKTFREDLFYRLNVVSLRTPPLRDRGIGDIELLVSDFLKKFAERLKKDVPALSDDVWSRLAMYTWPGNVRELENAMERAVVLCRDGKVTIDHLPPSIKAMDEHVPESTDEIRSLRSEMDKSEKRLILRALRECNWNRQNTAKLLKINRTTLFNKMRRYDLLGHTHEKTPEAVS